MPKYNKRAKKRLETKLRASLYPLSISNLNIKNPFPRVLSNIIDEYLFSSDAVNYIKKNYKQNELLGAYESFDVYLYIIVINYDSYGNCKLKLLKFRSTYYFRVPDIYICPINRWYRNYNATRLTNLLGIFQKNK
jgi:hypothetical protein